MTELAADRCGLRRCVWHAAHGRPRHLCPPQHLSGACQGTGAACQLAWNLCVCMCACLCACMCAHGVSVVRLCDLVFECQCACLCVHVCTCVCVCVHVMCVYMRVCISECMRVCVCMCVYT